jgi:serine/threonine protein kinase
VQQTPRLSTDAGRGPVTDPMLGRRLLHYSVVEVIGQGGMSVVYRGRDEHLARDVAIKVLHPFLAEKTECRARLAREARAVARLTHPNILQVFDFSGDRGSTSDDDTNAADWPHEGFIIAELVKGPTLKRFVEQHELWRVPEVGALVVWQLLLALQHAHDNGIIHRDLKPENVMVRDDGTLKLMDFGIAHVADQGGLTVTGTLLGSPAHMAPECIDGHDADARSDLFSMATVLYWITTGRLPFDAPTPHALLKQIVDGRASPAQQSSPRISDELARVIARGMATRPADRFSSARVFAEALREVIEKAGINVDDDVLRGVLRSPAEQLPTIAASVRSAFLERARRLFDEGQAARAFLALNRVLAADPADVDALALVEQISADEPITLDGEHPDEGAAPPSTTSQPLPPMMTTSSSTTQATLEAGLLGTTLAPSGTWPWRSAAVGVVAVGLVALAVWVAQTFDATQLGPPAVAPPPTVAATLDAASILDGADTTRGEPAALAGPTADRLVEPDGRTALDAAKKTTKAPPPSNSIHPSPSLSTTKTPTATPPPPPPTASSPVASGSLPSSRRVTLRVKPWADIIVDDVVVARNAMGHELDLPEGPHRVVFVNPRAKEHEVRFTVSRDGPPPLVSARLEPRPALVVVNCNVPDAFVTVDGVGKAAAETVVRPLVVALDDQSKSEREIFIYRQGFRPWRQRRSLSAGETLMLSVVLEPDLGDSGPTLPTP